ncbi:MAG: hypothetical protein ACRDTT_21720, partial [Pseudonocardiaceae bacterium]
LVIRSEDLFDDPVGGFGAIVEFLGLPPWQPSHFRNQSRPPGDYPSAAVDAAVAARLQETFRVPNVALVDLLGDTAPRW